MADTDLSMLELFRAEVETHAPAISEGLLALEKDPAQTKPIEGMMRAAHSIKGAARIVGVEPAVKLAHVMEDYFVAAQHGKVHLDSNVTDVLLRGVDTLTRVALDPNWLAGNEAEFQSMLTDIGALKEGKMPAKAAKPAKEKASTDDAFLDIDGDLDAERSEALRRAVLKLFDNKVQRVRFEFSKVHDIHPQGLAFLHQIAHAAKSHSTTLQVAGAGPQIRNVLRMTRLDQLIQIA